MLMHDRVADAEVRLAREAAAVPRVSGTGAGQPGPDAGLLRVRLQVLPHGAAPSVGPAGVMTVQGLWFRTDSMRSPKQSTVLPPKVPWRDLFGTNLNRF